LGDNMISFEDFKKMDLRVATIKEAADHPNADKLYLLKVSTGEEERQLVAGIRPYYTKEDLIGRQVVVILNLEPAVIRGVESQGMILAAQDKGGVTLLIPQRQIEDGSKIS
ncbi:MAG TPA: methionine--tRNA ligase subunit beta, partial [Candidatus Omnitrophica bacterium]|nr:methionine--tRNA ligase subunit beta [Candidatus Omnitrophota bacterium]